jgi:hypothetical protein
MRVVALIVSIALAGCFPHNAKMRTYSKITEGQVIGGIGFGMIMAGLTGFIATVSTAEDEAKATPRVDIKAQPTPKPDVKLPPGVQPAPPADPNATPTGSAAPNQPAP